MSAFSNIPVIIRYVPIQKIIDTKKRKIAIFGGLALWVFVGFLGLNLYSLNNLQFNKFLINQIDIGNTSADIIIETTNPTFLPGESEFDSSQFHFYARLDAPILGIIPYSLYKEYSYDDFQNMLSDIAKKGEKDNSELINPFN